MNVYLTGARAIASPSFTMHIAPAADVGGSDFPADWLEEDGKPKQIKVEFQFGKASVSDEIGRYLLKAGLAKKTRLILPTIHAPEEPALV